MYHRTNFDFEHQLLNNNSIKSFLFNQDTWNFEFEYLYFFLEIDGVLNTPIKYSNEYLEFLGQNFKLNPRVENSPQKIYEYWWGDTEKKKRARILNDKKFFWKFCKKYGLPYPETTDNFDELDSLSEKIISRYRFSFSGTGLKVKPKKDLVKIDRLEIVSSYLDRQMDFGIILNDLSIYKNNIDKYGQYKGSSTLTLEKQKYIRSQVDLKILKKLKFDSNFPIQLDGFMSDGQIFLHELNYRHTMGFIFQKIMKKHFPDRPGRIKVLKFKDYKNLDFKSKEIIALTPLRGEFSYRFGLVLNLC